MSLFVNFLSLWTLVRLWDTATLGMYLFTAFKDFLFTFADFSNVISKQDVKVLAEADDQEVVREIQVSI